MPPARDPVKLVQDCFAAIRARDWARVLSIVGPANAARARDTLIARLAMHRALAEAVLEHPGNLMIGYMGAPPVSAYLERYGHQPVSAFRGRPTLHELALRAPDQVLAEHFGLLSHETDLQMDLPIQIHARTPQDEANSRIRVSYLIPESDEPDAPTLAFPPEGERLGLAEEAGTLFLGVPTCLLELPQAMGEEWRKVAV